jgi:hypothetical protein
MVRQLVTPLLHPRQPGSRTLAPWLCRAADMPVIAALRQCQLTKDVVCFAVLWRAVTSCLQGVLSLSRKAAVLSGFLQVGGNPPVSFPPATTAATGPVLLGLQMLYGFNFSATISQVSVAYYRTVDAPAPPPEPSPSPKPPTVAPPSGSPGPSVQPADNCSISVLDGPAAVYEYGSGQWQPMGVGGGGATSSLSM